MIFCLFVIIPSNTSQPSDASECLTMENWISFTSTAGYPVQSVYIRDDVKCTTELENHAVQVGSL